ncbi:hypothetical protein [Bradyrhizobium sp. SZCCHNPS1003]|uniref:hypothetical protein n=1 Tax=Bradyrhizobium sp. SZCCHNPS1003 TaxID=3057330 RepID=UPI0028E9922F|nr:hypothetical protein [Bradyrhizobium sp. SZCCHNPS1003]
MALTLRNWILSKTSGDVRAKEFQITTSDKTTLSLFSPFETGDDYIAGYDTGGKHNRLEVAVPFANINRMMIVTTRTAKEDDAEKNSS